MKKVSNVSVEAQRLLDADPCLAKATSDAVDSIACCLSCNGLAGSVSIDKWVDVEVRDWERLVIKVVVPAEDHKQLLRVWEEADRAVQVKIGDQTRQVVIMFDSAHFFG